jgi:hypothetical protein
MSECRDVGMSGCRDVGGINLKFVAFSSSSASISSPLRVDTFLVFVTVLFVVA